MLSDERLAELQLLCEPYRNLSEAGCLRIEWAAVEMLDEITRLRTGAERDRMSLLIVFTNDGTGTDDSANYNVKVLVTRTATDLVPIWQGRVEGHNRSDNWQLLVSRLLKGTEHV